MSIGVPIGINTPIVVGVPGIEGAWEATAGASELLQIAELSDALGFDHLTCSEHTGVPQGAWSSLLNGPRGTRYWDPLAVLSFWAARTTQIRLVTSILVLAYSHPLEIAKRYGTLDQLSGGRAVIGVGIGTLREEFDLLGVPYAERAARADDAIRALRASLSQLEPAYEGEYYSFSGFVIDPHAQQEHVPIWVGGNSEAALRRATTLADGWLPGALPLDTVRQLLAKYPPQSDSFDAVVRTPTAIDPIEHPEETLSGLHAIVEAGATIILAELERQSLSHYLEQLEALAELAGLPRHLTAERPSAG